jgi:O-antigen/teichoic acid export membrane protein
LVIVFGFRVEGLLWGEVLALALAFPFLLLLTTKGVSIRPQHFHLPDALQMWRYAGPLALGNVALWGLRLSDRYIIGFFRPLSEVGLYSAVYNITGKSIDMLVALFLLSMGPMVMNTWESQGREATEETLMMITRLFLIVCLPAAAGLSVLAFPFVALLTAQAYHEGYHIVGYVAFSSFTWGLSQIAGRGLLIGKATRRFAINQFLAVLVNLGLNLALVPRFGFVAAGSTTLIGYGALFALHAYASRRYLTWRLPFRTLRNVVIAAVCMGLAVWGICGMSGNGDEVHPAYLLLSIVVAVPIYFVSLLLLGEANEEEKTAAKHLWYRVAGSVAWATRERRQ